MARCAWVLALLAGMGMGQQSATPAAPQEAAQEQLPAAPAPQNNVPKPAPPPTPPALAPAPRANEPGPAATPPPSPPNQRDEMMSVMRVDVRFVVVPVTVKDLRGHLVEGLTKNDFAVFESGVQQQIKLFTSDPFPLSAAVVLDVGLPDQVLRKVNETLPALAAAFSQFDEIAFYTFGNSVRKELDFSAVTERYANSIKFLKKEGRKGGADVPGGPLGQSGPSINGKSVDPSVPPGGNVYVNYREAHVLNDAILAAAEDLATRPRDRRKLIFVISDGKETGSHANYGQVLKVLLSNGISVYGVAVGDSAMPVFRDLEKVNAPFSGHGDLLPRYTKYTGGDVFPEFDRNAIENAYAHVTEQARNQYTLGYNAKAGPSNTYRTIEVIVHRPNLKVHAKDGYYPLPIAPSL
ncbi:MAG: VWA domain-containing protein [Terriglobales bacterium]